MKQTLRHWNFHLIRHLRFPATLLQVFTGILLQNSPSFAIAPREISFLAQGEQNQTRPGKFTGSPMQEPDSSKILLGLGKISTGVGFQQICYIGVFPNSSQFS